MLCCKSKPTWKLMMLGLDGSGKTGLLKALAGESYKQVHKTHGFNIENFETEKSDLNIWDIGGDESQRDYWTTYFNSADGFFYVIDASDAERLEETGESLMFLLGEKELENLPLVILVNKKDLVGFQGKEFVEDLLVLSDIRDRKWKIVESSAKTGAGLLEAVEWIVGVLEMKAGITKMIVKN